MPGFGRGPPAPGAPPGRGPAGRGGIWDCPDCGPPGRGAPGRGADWPPPTPNGLLATRGPPGRVAPGRGPGVGVGTAGRAKPGSDTGAAGVVAAAGAAAGATVGAGAGEVTGAASAGRATGLGAGAGAAFLAGAGAATGNASRSRRATGASTVDDALLTNSPSSLSFARTSLLGTPSSFASSCTRALPATGLLRRRTGGQPARSRFRWETHSWLALHRVLIGLLLTIAAYSVSGSWRGHFRLDPPVYDPAIDSTYVRTGVTSRWAVLRKARPNARRRSASSMHPAAG